MEGTLLMNKNYIELTLQNYTAMKKELRMLEFELGRIHAPLNVEAIEGEMLSQPCYGRVSGSKVRDKASDIVVEHIDKQRNGRYRVLKNLIYNIYNELQRLEFYISLLPKGEADVIRQFDFERLGWAEIAEKYDVAQRTLERRRKRGIAKLAYFYSILDQIEHGESGSKGRLRFTGHIHEERYLDCLNRAGNLIAPGIEAMLYIICGCNELWNAGPNSFYGFEDGGVFGREHITQPLTDKGEKLLRLAHCLSRGCIWDRLADIMQSHFRDLEDAHLELAIEALLIALFLRYR